MAVVGSRRAHTIGRPRSGPGAWPIRTTPDIWAQIIAGFAAPNGSPPST
jgi:hypothetical protein